MWKTCENSFNLSQNCGPWRFIKMQVNSYSDLRVKIYVYRQTKIAFEVFWRLKMWSSYETEHLFSLYG